MAKIRISADTNSGKIKIQNEDHFLIDKEHKIFVVAGGVKGNDSGKLGSEGACKIIRREIVNNFSVFRNLEVMESRGRYQSPEIAVELVEKSLQTACLELYKYALNKANIRKVAIAAIVMIVFGDKAIIAHVGNCRGYIVRNKKIHQLTDDHTMIQEKIAEGVLTPEEAKKVAYKDIVTKSLGVHESVSPSAIVIDLSPNDRIFLATDGFYSELSNQLLLQEIDSKYDIDTVIRRLNHQIMSKRARDNFTALFIEIEQLSYKKEIGIDKKMEILKKIPLFRNFGYKQLVKLYNVSRGIRHKSGNTIILEGDSGDELYVLLKGKAIVLKGEIKVAEFLPGVSFGEMALIENQPRSASIKASDHCYLLKFSGPDLMKMVEKEPEIGVQLWWNLLESLTPRLKVTGKDLLIIQMERISQIIPKKYKDIVAKSLASIMWNQ